MNNLFFRKIDAALAIIAAIITFDFIRVPLTNDVAIFQGVANIADKFYPFPQGIDLAWEAKPIGNRVINYLLLNAAELVVPIENHAAFSIMVKGVAVFAVVLVALYSAKVFRDSRVFWIIFFSFITCANFCNLQAEWWAVLLSVATLLLLCDNKPFTAGMCFILIGTIKGITAFLFIPIILAVLLFRKPQQNEAVRVFAGIVAMGCVVCIAQVTIWKNMLPDLLLAPAIVGAGRIRDIPELVLAFVGQGVTSLFYIPVVFAAVIIALLLWIEKKDDLLLLAGVWVSTLVIVLAHGEYFIYQYFLLVFPAIVTILYTIRQNRVHRNVWITVVLALCIVYAVFNSTGGIFTKTERDFFGQQEAYATEMNAQFHLDKEPSVLYLDAGVAPYYIRANSTSRYICPLPVQRDRTYNSVNDTQAFCQIYRDIAVYDGEYIVMDGNENWIMAGESGRNGIQEKLKGYELVWEKGWRVYRTSNNNLYNEM